MERKRQIIAGSGHGTLNPWSTLLPPFHYECSIRNAASSVGVMVALDYTIIHNSHKNFRIKNRYFRNLILGIGKNEH